MLTFRHFMALSVLVSSGACVQSAPLGCPDDLEFFRTQLWEPVMSVQCVACHKKDGFAADTRMVLLPPGEPRALEFNFLTVRAIAREQLDGASLLLLKPSGTHPQGHGGGTVVAQGSARYVEFQRFSDRVNGVEGACESSRVVACTPEGLDPNARRQLRMLTRFEYDNTLRDLLYLDTPSTWGQALPAEEVANGFDNAAAARTVGPLLTDKLVTASEQAAEAAMAKLSRHVSCSPGEACARRYIQDFGARAFRSPLSDVERARYQTLYTSVAAEEGYQEGLEAVTSAMLLSPRFLYRAELGTVQADGRYVLDDYEVASELSYLFWGSMPDEELLTRAREGALRTPEQLATQARRLLDSPRSRPQLDHFVSQWLELEKLEQAQKDPSTFASFTPEVRAAMRAETLAFFDHVVHQGGGQLPELFSANYTFATDALAAFYGLGSPPTGTPLPGGLRQWPLEGSGRGGLLTQGSILASHATPQSSSPVRRGKLVRERLLCQPLPPAPPGLNLALPAVDARQSNRQRFQQHSSNPACSTCHQMMDPIGFGFEQFDSVGRYQPRTATDEPVDASGEVLVSPATQGAFTGVSGLQEKLARSPDVQDCFSLQWLRFGYGVSGEEASCATHQLTERFRQRSLSIPELLVSLTQLPRFTQRWGTTVGAPGGGGPSGPGTPPPPVPVPGDAQVSVSVQSDWGSGYCHTVQVANPGTAPLTWRVALSVEGSLTNTWNTRPSSTGGRIEFTGEDYNATLRPGASTSFGFCARR